MMLYFSKNNGISGGDASSRPEDMKIPVQEVEYPHEDADPGVYHERRK